MSEESESRVLRYETIIVTLIGRSRAFRSGFQSTISGHTFSAGESMDVMVPHKFDGSALASDKSNALWTALNKERGWIGIEICYSSTLGNCWILRRDANGRSTTTEVRTCPETSSISFSQ